MCSIMFWIEFCQDKNAPVPEVFHHLMRVTRKYRSSAPTWFVVLLILMAKSGNAGSSAYLRNEW